MQKIFTFDKIDWHGNGKRHAVKIEINLRETPKGPVFTACGWILSPNGRGYSGGGQCLEDLLPFFKNNVLYNKIYYFWKKYHLNDMHAGTPDQEAFINYYFKNKTYNYNEACEALKKNHLYEVKLNDGSLYKYGHSWLYQAIPAADLEEIKKLLTSE